MNLEQLNEITFDKRMATRTGATLVVFTSLFCGACKRLKRLLDAAASDLPCELFEVDAGQSPGLVDDLEVFHLPAMFLYVNGELKGPVHAAAQVDQLKAAIGQMLET